MPLNRIKPNSNMYQGWLTHTFNTVKGKCPHDCAYCYMKKWGEQTDLHFDEKELKTDLGEGNFIFVGSSCDLFAAEISLKWIADTLEHCCKFNNRYLFQSKNPERIISNRHRLPSRVILGTTIETNRVFKEMCNAPPPSKRAFAMNRAVTLFDYNTMVTIEPIMSFDLDILVDLIKSCGPDFVNIGANTNYKVKLTEPSQSEVIALIEELRNITEIKIKSNLKRLMK